jgi:hypothetical protein
MVGTSGSFEFCCARGTPLARAQGVDARATRFVWLTWLVVGFAFTYGNYLGSFTRA